MALREARTQRLRTTKPAKNTHRGNSRRVTAGSTTYILTGIERSFWKRVKVRAANDGITVKAAIERLLQDWLDTPLAGAVDPVLSTSVDPTPRDA